MRLVFLGTADIARPALRALVEGRHDVAAVVTQPDRPRGRSSRAQPPPLKEEALALGLGCPILQPERLGRQTRERLAALSPEAGIVVAYGQILSREVLLVPPRSFLNVHASLLPRWRGAAPIQRAIAAGEREIGVTIMRLVPRLDAGPILAVESTAAGPRETAGEALARLGGIGARLLVATLERLERGPVPEVPQDESLATYAPPIRKEEGAIDWTRPPEEVDAHVRGMAPWPGAFSFLERGRGPLVRVEVLDAIAEPRAPAGAAPGSVVEAQGERVVVACGGGAVSLCRVKPSGKREMGASEWLRGRGVAAGERFRMP